MLIAALAQHAGVRKSLGRRHHHQTEVRLLRRDTDQVQITRIGLVVCFATSDQELVLVVRGGDEAIPRWIGGPGEKLRRVERLLRIVELP